MNAADHRRDGKHTGKECKVNTLRLRLRALRRDCCSPFGRADVASVGGEEPVVPVKIAGTVLALAVDGMVKVFNNRGASRFRSVVVRVNIGDEHGKRLGAVTQFARCESEALASVLGAVSLVDGRGD